MEEHVPSKIVLHPFYIFDLVGDLEDAGNAEFTLTDSSAFLLSKSLDSVYFIQPSLLLLPRRAS